MPRRRVDFVGAILCACGEPAEMATFFFNGDETEIACTKCHVIAVVSLMSEIDRQIAAENEAEPELVSATG